MTKVVRLTLRNVSFIFIACLVASHLYQVVFLRYSRGIWTSSSDDLGTTVYKYATYIEFAIIFRYISLNIHHNEYTSSEIIRFSRHPCFVR